MKKLKIFQLPKIAYFIGFALISADLSATEQSQWKHCPQQVVPEQWPRDESVSPLDLGATSIDANQMEVSELGLTTLSGAVDIRHNDNTVHTDRAEYDESKSHLHLKGHVRFWTEGLYWQGLDASIDRIKNESHLSHGDYRLLERRGHGHAEEVIDKPDQNITRLKNVDYSTCPSQVHSQQPWRLHAKELKLDHASNWGRALHTVIRVKDVPVFYLPYLSFPLTDERMSGFLPLTIGTTRDSGFDIRTPYYWNISPEQDATFTPRLLVDRGIMLGSQYRYLRPSGRGQLELEYIPRDDLFDDDDRYLLNANIEQVFARGKGRFLLDFTQVSDRQYFEDLSTSIDVTSQRLLDRRAELHWRSNNWSLLSRIQRYQNVDNTLLSSQQPYDRLPQFYFQTHLPQGNKKFNFKLNAEAVYFDRDNSLDGGRFDIMPEISFPIRNIASFIVPKLKLRHTHYFLDRDDAQDSSPSRTLPILSVDSGVFVEGDLSFGGKHYLHTLEPRLFYLYIPNSDQSDLPIFDTGQFDISFAQLFRDDRFNAADRVGDANQLTLALTTRLLNKETGREQASLSLGQIRYFRDRNVTLLNSPAETTNSSDLILEAAFNLNQHWTTRYNLQWDPHEKRTDLSSLNLRYQPNNESVFNAAYRMRRALVDIEQLDFSMRWPVNPNWSVVGRWNYSLQNDRTIEGLLGFEYNSCCWATRVIGRHFLRNTEGDFDNAVFLQFEMKGLAGFGRGTEHFLQRNIPGYHHEF